MRDDAIDKQVMALKLAGSPEYKIAEALGISRRQVKKICTSRAYKDALKELADRALEDAQNAFKAQMEELRPLAIEALRDNLVKKKIEAVRTYIEVIGLKDKKTEERGEASITVVLPGAAPEKTIEVEVKNVPESSES